MDPKGEDMVTEREGDRQTGEHSVSEHLEETQLSAGKHGRWFYLAWVIAWIAVLAFLAIIYAILA